MALLTHNKFCILCRDDCQIDNLEIGKPHKFHDLLVPKEYLSNYWKSLSTELSCLGS